MKKPSDEEINKVFEEWFIIRSKRLTKADRNNPAFRNLSRLAFEAGIEFMGVYGHPIYQEVVGGGLPQE